MKEKETLNIVKDEEGAVMIEFLIAAPILLVFLLSVFFFMDLNRFQISAQHLAGVQTWRWVGEEKSDNRFKNSDDFTINSLNMDQIAGVFGEIRDIKEKIDNFLNILNLPDTGSWNIPLNDMDISLKNSLAAVPPGYSAMVQNGGWSSLTTVGVAAMIYDKAGVIHNIPDKNEISPFSSLGLSRKNMTTEVLNPENLGHSSDKVIYKNTSFLRPLRNILGMASQEEISEETDSEFFSINYNAKQSIMFDAFKAHSQKRIDNIDQLTTIAKFSKSPGLELFPYRFSYGVLAIISGDFSVVENFGGFQEIEDSITKSGNEIVSLMVNAILGLISSKQMDPFEKVDKTHSYEEEITEDGMHELQEISDYNRYMYIVE